MRNSSLDPKAQTRTGRGLQDFALLLTSRGVSIAAGIAFVAISARLFPASDIAFLAWITILSSAAETVRGFGITNVLTRQLPLLVDNPSETGRWIATHFVYASLPLLIAPFLIAPLVPFVWTVAAFGAAMQLIANNHIYVFQAMGRFRMVSVATVLSTVLQRIAPLAIAWHWSLGVADFIAIQTVLSVPVCLALTYALRHHLLKRSIVPWRECWPQARAFYAAGIVRYGATQADQLLVALLFPPAALAPYFLIRRLYSAVVVILSAGVDVLIPRLGRRARQGMEHVRLEQARVLKQAAAFCAIGGCLVAANAGSLIPLIVGPAYAAPPLVVPALMVAALGYGLFSFALAGEVIAGPPKETFRIAMVAAAVPLVATPLLVPYAGVAALPISMTIGYVAAGWTALRHHAELRLSTWLACGGMAAVGLLAAAQEELRLNAARTFPLPLALNVAAICLATGIAYRSGLLTWSPNQ